MATAMQAAIDAAQAYDLAHRPRTAHWGRVSDEQVARLLIGAQPHLADVPAPPERPVFVVAVGHDLGADDAARIQRAVVTALRERTP